MSLAMAEAAAFEHLSRGREALLGEGSAGATRSPRLHSARPRAPNKLSVKKRRSQFVAGAKWHHPPRAQVPGVLLMWSQGQAVALLSLVGLNVLLAGAAAGCSPQPQDRQN